MSSRSHFSSPFSVAKPDAGTARLHGPRQYRSFTVTTELLRMALCVWAAGFAFALAGFVLVASLFVVTGFVAAILLPILMVILLACPAWPSAQNIFLIIVCVIRTAKPRLLVGPAYSVERPPRFRSLT